MLRDKVNHIWWLIKIREAEKEEEEAKGQIHETDFDDKY